MIFPVSNLSSLELPLGTIISWVTKVSGYQGETVDLPPGWQRCDGSTIEHPSPWAGRLTPDLNNQKRFLRGGHDSEQLALEEDSIKSHTHSTRDAHFIPFNGPGDTDCPSGYTHKPTIAWYLNIVPDYGVYDDLVCERELMSGPAGTTETKPKNMNVIFIIKVF